VFFTSSTLPFTFPSTLFPTIFPFPLDLNSLSASIVEGTASSIALCIVLFDSDSSGAGAFASFSFVTCSLLLWDCPSVSGGITAASVCSSFFPGLSWACSFCASRDDFLAATARTCWLASCRYCAISPFSSASSFLDITGIFNFGFFVWDLVLDFSFSGDFFLIGSGSAFFIMTSGCSDIACWADCAAGPGSMARTWSSWLSCNSFSGSGASSVFCMYIPFGNMDIISCVRGVLFSFLGEASASSGVGGGVGTGLGLFRWVLTVVYLDWRADLTAGGRCGQWSASFRRIWREPCDLGGMPSSSTCSACHNHAWNSLSSSVCDPPTLFCKICINSWIIIPARYARLSSAESPINALG